MKTLFSLLTFITLSTPVSAEYIYPDSLREECGTDQVCYVAECDRLGGYMEGINCFHD